MDKSSKHTLTIGCSEESDKIVVVHYSGDVDLEQGRKTFQGLTVPQDYPHHAAWAMLGRISGEFAKGVSTAHVTATDGIIPDVVISRNKVQVGISPALQIHPEYN